MEQKTEIQKEIQQLNKKFLHSSDFMAKEIAWGPDEQAILCFYSSLVKKSDVDRNLHILRLARNMPTPSDSNTGQEDANGQKAEQAESNKNNNDSEQAKSNQQKNDSKQNEPASQPALRLIVQKLRSTNPLMMPFRIHLKYN